MASWVRSITSPFRKARTYFNNNHSTTTRDNNKSQQQQQQQQQQEHDKRVMDLQGEVMACAYEDVQVMWSILDNSKPKLCNITS